MGIIEVLISLTVMAILSISMQVMGIQISKSTSQLTTLHQHTQTAINTIESIKAGHIHPHPTLTITPLSPTLTLYTVTISDARSIEYIDRRSL
jgi:type II secretory pathway pseudopilin PulG